MQSSANTAVPVNGISPGYSSPPPLKTLVEEFGDSIKVDDITYLECVIAFKRGVIFKWIRDVDKTSYKVILKDQDFNH